MRRVDAHMGDELLTTEEAAAFLKCTPNALRVRRSLGTGPAFVMLPGDGAHGRTRVRRSVRYWKSDVIAWCMSGGRQYQTKAV